MDGAAGATVAGRDVVRPRDNSTPPPFDWDAT
jgi:hypothetical protein